MAVCFAAWLYTFRVNRFVIALSLLVSCGWCASQTPREPLPVYVIHRPTIIAFFVSTQNASDDPEGEAASDFSFYASRVQNRLRTAGIDFELSEARTFQVRAGAKVRTFHVGKIGVGYYLIAPGRQPKVLWGVDTDEGLVEQARAYFRIPIK